MCHGHETHHHRRNPPAPTVEHPPGDTDPRRRPSDDDRDHTVAQLSAHTGAGHLEIDELEARLDAVYRAATVAELTATTDDLPHVVTAAEAAGRDDRRRSARREAFAPYLGVMVLLVAIWALSGAEYFWPIWPMLGWGIPLFLGLWHDPGRVDDEARHNRRQPAAPV